VSKILTISCDDAGVVKYALTKPTVKKLEEAVSVLSAMSNAVGSASPTGAKIVEAYGALNDVLDAFCGVPDAPGRVEQAEPGNDSE
jgi:hypothetical protein